MDFKSQTKEEAYALLVRAGIIRPGERTLAGQEKDEMWMILQFLDIGHQTNNQRFITDHYQYGNFHYTVTFFNATDYEIIEITRDINGQ